MKVLIVDEDEQTKVLQRILKNRFTTDEFKMVYNLHDARRVIWIEKFDVLAIDIMMPADEEAVPMSSQDSGLISGLQLIDMIKTDDKCINHSTPCILLTGVPSVLHSKIKEAESEYVGRYFQKPTKPEDLYNGLKKAYSEGARK